jgi:hypothetical protein
MVALNEVPVFLRIFFGVTMMAGCALHAQPAAPAAYDSGLAKHDFLFAGESHDRKIFIVRQGKIAWSYEDPEGHGEISDAVMLSNGNILFAHQFGVTEITKDKKVVWNYDVPKGREVHTAMPIGKDRVLYLENGNPAMMRVVNIVSGRTEKEWPIPTRNPNGTHGQFRHARLTDRGTLMVANKDSDKVVEYDADGKELWSFPAQNPWGVTPLPGGNVLITDDIGIREVTRRGDTVWNFGREDVAQYHFGSLQQAWRLPNGNTIVNQWANEWTNKSTWAESEPVQAVELTPAKQVVWVLRAWTPPNWLGPATTIQVLDSPSAPEDVHFGDIR